jgi:ribosomal protein L7/L12
MLAKRQNCEKETTSMEQEYERIVQLEARMHRMEMMMQALLSRLGIDAETLVSGNVAGIEAVRQAVLAGNKILAIKIYREMYGAGLKQAKDAVDQIDRQLRRG